MEISSKYRQSDASSHNELTNDVFERLKNYYDRASLKLRAAQILAVNHDRIVNQSMSGYFGNQDEQIDVNSGENSSVYCLRTICDIYLRGNIYSLGAGDRDPLERLQDDLFFLAAKYLTMGSSITTVIKVLQYLNTLIANLVNNSDIASELNTYLEYVVNNLLSEFNNADQSCVDKIKDLLNQEQANLLQSQHQGLAKLRQAWLAGDEEDQTETWNYLRDVLNPDSPSYSPVSV